MHVLLVPVLSGMTNGTNFISPTLATSIHQISAMAGINDSPLEFKKMQLAGAGPMDLVQDIESTAETMDRARRSTSSNRAKIDVDRGHSSDRHDASNSSIDSSDKSVPSMTGNGVGAPFSVAGAHNQNDILFNGMMGMPQSLMMMPGMMNIMDPTMMGFPIMGQMNPMQQQPPPQQQSSQPPQQSPASDLNSLLPTKEVITCKSCTLFPPNPSAPLPTT